MDDIRLRIILGVGGFEALQKATTAIGNVGPAAERAATGLNKSGAAATKNQGFFAKLSDTLKKTEAMYDRVYRAGFQLQLVGDQIADTGMRGLEILGGTVEAYRGYDKMLRRAGVALNTNDEYQGKLNDAILDSAKALGIVNPEEVAGAYYMWGAAAGTVVDSSRKLADIQSVVEKVLIATAAAGGDLETNLKGVYGITSIYNLGTGKAADVTEKLALLTERTAADFGDLTSAFTYIGPLAGSLGVTFEDTAQMVGLLADAGQRGSRAGRGLSMIIEGLSAPSEKAEKALLKVAKATGFSGDEWKKYIFPKGEFVGMRDFIMKMATGMEDMTDAERGYILSTGFTNNATRALIPLIEKQILLNKENTDAHRDLTSVIDEEKYSLKTAASFFETMNKAMTTSIDGVIGSLQNTFFPIIQQVALTIMEVVTPAIEWLKVRIDELSKFLSNNPGLTKFIVTAIAVGSIIMVVGGTVLALLGSFLLLFAGIGAAGVILGALASAAAPVIAAFLAIGAVVAALVVAWQSNFLGIQEKVAVGFDMVSKAISVVSGWLTKAYSYFMTLISGGDAVAACIAGLPAPIQAVTTWLAQLFLGIQSGVMQILPTLQNLGAVAVELFTVHIVPNVQKVVAAFQTFWAFIEPILIQLGTIIVDVIINKVIPMLVEFANAVGSFLIDILKEVGPVIDSVVELFTGLINFIFVDLAPVWGWLLDTILIPFFTTVVNLFADRLGAVLDIVKGVFEVIKGVIQVVLSVIKGIIDTFLAVVNGKWDKAGQALSTMVNGIWNGIKAIINGVATVIRGIIDFLLTKILEIVGAGLGRVKGLFDDALGAILGIIKGGVTGITNAGKGLLNALWNGIKSVIGTLSSNVTGLIGKFVGWFTSKLPDKMVNIGRNVIQGMWNGILSLAPWIANQVKNLVTNIIPGPIRDALGIHSPSRVTMELGKHIAMGLALGITENTRPVLASVDHLTGAVVARATSASNDFGREFGQMTASAHMSFSTANERTLTLRVEVVSPDGSIDRLTADQLAGVLKGADLLSAIEHAASLD